ncbi:MAG: hypothetical protein ACTTJ9_06835 [Segatella oris]|uniref:hypothetical protein n=1 Tax=Segatella oris TaxID=28135 RepID=UPI003FA2C06E
MKEKKEQTLHRRPYVCPWSEVLATENVNPLLAGSPAVQPGGGGGGHVSIETPPEDNEDNEISGAKSFNLWEE